MLLNSIQSTYKTPSMSYMKEYFRQQMAENDLRKELFIKEILERHLHLFDWLKFKISPKWINDKVGIVHEGNRFGVHLYGRTYWTYLPKSTTNKSFSK